MVIGYRISNKIKFTAILGDRQIYFTPLFYQRINTLHEKPYIIRPLCVIAGLLKHPSKLGYLIGPKSEGLKSL